MANEGTTQTGSAVDKVQSDAGSILATAPEVTAPDGVEVKAPDANPATGGVRSRTNGAMASTAGKATRKRKRVTFAVKPDGDVAHEAESTAAMAGSAEVVTNVTRHGAGRQPRSEAGGDSGRRGGGGRYDVRRRPVCQRHGREDVEENGGRVEGDEDAATDEGPGLDGHGKSQ
ncbi:hypothetical protein PF003_g32713 [Phytophthora fragariae]|nr:hypothetical protein PF003_g32713 [Phytophthora fragariae]